MHLLAHVCLCLVVALHTVRSEVFTAMVELEKTLQTEQEIAILLKDYIESEEARLAHLKSLAEDYDRHSTFALENPDHFVGNPVNAFLLVKRFTVDWDKEFQFLKDNITNELVSTIEIKRQHLPDYEDLNGAAAALLRLQDTYQLDTADIARGEVGGVKTQELTAEECFELGRYAYTQRDFYHTIMWMQEALDQDARELNKTADRALILDYLSYAMSMQGNAHLALVLTNELLEIDPSHQRAKNNKFYFERMLEDEKFKGQKRGDTGLQRVKNPRNIDDYRNSEEFYAYESLCRGEDIMPIKNAHKLKCKYAWYGHPYLYLARVKEEEMHFDPWLVVYHDILSDNEMNFVKSFATPKLNRATVQNSVTGKLETATYRISKSAWLKDADHPILSRINKRIGTVTGLNVETAEELQVANYGIGGHYEPHFDYARKEEKNAFKRLGTGNRIATFLIYMSDIPSGGATVFPYIGLKLFPKKGTAAFWYNLHKSGEGIFNTRHAACPVLVGNKWVMNKWIHERGQEFRRPCSLSSKL
ncbi:prolyl 4-hydroxylase subunit alpha-1-like isoform X2 [Octopus vulgaris]|uniref:Prolyl 4-hydroxylase subunit alpha-1-like isoform X2 n=2 Tax=Octopus TaxID=6643 RepID=A0AA36BT53_OCTVU|nr:prolyl 4-hydroxylase subunit alpha-1 isoform X1 [Octopus sinensis]CAI9739422.1 prolyl 4-hydroxylase subunit alpha-1-like isoform X2 [Octopus vulgaris]